MILKSLLGGIVFLGIGIAVGVQELGSKWLAGGLILVGIILLGYGLGGKNLK